MSDVDVVVASSSGWAHGLHADKGAKVVVYCHNPARWIYQSSEYATREVEKFGLRLLRSRLESWDKRAARRAAVYLANSTTVARRIRSAYGIEAEILHPPVSVDLGGEQEAISKLSEDFWLTIDRGRGYKGTQVLADALSRLNDGQLVVVGSSPRQSSDSSVIRYLGRVTDAQLRWLYSNARALVSVSSEDFGLTPIEANSFGTPVAVLRSGGFLDTTDEGVSGVFIEGRSTHAVVAALREFPTLDRGRVRLHAKKFGEASFANRIRRIVSDLS